MTNDSDINQDCIKLINTCKTITLATTSDQSSHSSYAPFIHLDNKFYILVSALAEHTAQMKNAQNPIGCMMIVDEVDCSQIFARRRLMFKSTPNYLDRNCQQWPILIDSFKQRFGEIIKLLDSLPDFSIFELKPQRAVFVRGFGDAHKISDKLFEKLQ